MEESILIRYLYQIADKIDILKTRNGEKGKESLLFAYRGESKDYGRTKFL